MAEAYIKDAEISLEEAKAQNIRENFHRCVRRAQECVGLSLKGILRIFGLEYPKSHDVSLTLQMAQEMVDIPQWLREIIPLLSMFSEKLAQQRGPSFYGDERAFIPPESIYNKEDAKEALRYAEQTLKSAKRLLEETGEISNGN